MTPHEYLKELLDRQSMNSNDAYDPDVQELRNLRAQVERDLREAYGSVPKLYYGGSFAKSTMIRASYDLDILVRFPQTDRRPLRNIYAEVYDVLVDAGYTVEPKTVSLQLRGTGGFHVDVVPARVRNNVNANVTLYKNGEDTTLQTNLEVHVNVIRRSRARDLIRLAKLWRTRWNLPLATFPLEQIVMIALTELDDGVLHDEQGRSISKLTNYDCYLLYVLRFLATHIKSIAIIDPANMNNIITIPYETSEQVYEAALASLNAALWEEVIW